MRPPARIAVAVLLAACLPALAGAEIFRWVDAQGNEHFTQDLWQVPPPLRAQAERTAKTETPRTSPPPAAMAQVAHTRVRPGRTFEIPFEKQGSAMLVYVRLNDRVTAPFLVDTGASDVVVPAHVALAAGIEVRHDTPRQAYQTANGMVESPVVTLASVEVGDARVENVRGSLSGGMSVGLLGGSFFNNFTIQIDPAANVITLSPNAHVRGGANLEEWRARFHELRSSIEMLDAHLSALTELDDGRVLAQRRQALVDELEALEHEANVANVPQAWRE
ncbi:MAG TPA: TIGR02281 family clan AA aspartic protease [Myxococcota bacterium]